MKEEKNEVQCMSMLCAKEIASWAKKPNPNYNTHIGQSSTQPRMHENMIIMLENAMHEHVGIKHQHLTQKFHTKKLKNPKFSQKLENLGLNA